MKLNKSKVITLKQTAIKLAMQGVEDDDGYLVQYAMDIANSIDIADEIATVVYEHDRMNLVPSFKHVYEKYDWYTVK